MITAAQNNVLQCSLCSVKSCAIETLTTSEILNMEDRTYQANYQRGEMIRKQETPVDSLIYLRSGYIKEFLSHRNSADQVVQIIKPKSYIGLMGMCLESFSLYSYEAITETELCFIEKETFSKLISSNGNFAKQILIELSNESLKNHHRFLSLNKTQTFGKVAGLLLYLSDQVFEKESFELWLSRTELAQMIGTTRESVTRALSYFQEEEIIEYNKSMITIKEADRLSDISVKG